MSELKTQSTVLNEDRDKKISFEEHTHTYFIGNKKASTSISTFSGGFFAPFDGSRHKPEMRSVYKAKALIGTITHALIESKLLNLPPPDKYTICEDTVHRQREYQNYHVEDLIEVKKNEFYREWSYLNIIEIAQRNFQYFELFCEEMFPAKWKLEAAEYMIWGEI